MGFKKNSNRELYIIIEIFELCFVLYILCLLISYPLSYIFAEFDKYIVSKVEENKISETGYKTIKYIETFIQLFIIAIVYNYIEDLIYYIPTIIQRSKTKIQSHTTAQYAIHIVMIVMLIEMNSSLVTNLHYVALINPLLDNKAH